MSRLYLLDTGALGAWKHFSVSDHSDHTTLIEGVRQWWDEFAKRFSPTDVVACFDCSRESNWRKQLFVEYKSARDTKAKDEAFIAGMRDLPKLFAALGVPMLRADGFEADDMIATMSAHHEGEVIAVTSDKDMHQLVDERVRVYDPRPNKAGDCILFDEAKVTEKHGIPPHRLREFLAIDGDKSDSIPGVEGWGKVAALTAIQQTKSRAELVRKALAGTLEGITAKKQAAFAAQLAAFELSYKLVGLRFDAPIPDGFDTRIAAPKQDAA